MHHVLLNPKSRALDGRMYFEAKTFWIVLVPLCPSNRQFTVTLQCDVFDVPTSYRDISAFYLEIPLTHWSKTRGTLFGSCESHQLAAVQSSKWLGFTWCLSASSYSYKGCQEKFLASVSSVARGYLLHHEPCWHLELFLIQAPFRSIFLTHSATSGTRSTTSMP